jgi:hypothetical protein
MRLQMQVQLAAHLHLLRENIPVAMRKGETPVHIPNTKVKAFPAEDTMLATAWENRWLPDIYEKEALMKGDETAENKFLLPDGLS